MEGVVGGGGWGVGAAGCMDSVPLTWKVERGADVLVKNNTMLKQMKRQCGTGKPVSTSWVDYNANTCISGLFTSMKWKGSILDWDKQALGWTLVQVTHQAGFWLYLKLCYKLLPAKKCSSPFNWLKQWKLKAVALRLFEDKQSKGMHTKTPSFV